MNTSDHLDQVMIIMSAAFDPVWGEAWNRAQVSGALATPNTHLLLLDPAGLPVKNLGPPAAGFVLTRAASDEEELLLIAVKPEHRGHGLGQSLIEKMCTNARARGTSRIFLEMRCNNPAEHLYRKVGFEPIGRRKDYYRLADGRRLDAITFALSI